MNEEGQTLEPWNDESNMSMNDRRGTFLKVLCILSWISTGLALIVNFLSYIGGKEAVLENISRSEDELQKLDEGSFFYTIMKSTIEIQESIYPNFDLYYGGNILAVLIGGLAVYMMFMLKKTGFALYILYCALISIVSIYTIGAGNTGFEIFISIAFIIMYGVNLKRMTA